MNILLDADMLLFQCAAAAQREVEWEPDMWLQFCDAAEIRDAYWEAVNTMVHDLGWYLENVTHCFTDKSAWRRRIWPGYKANRKTPKPLGFAAVRAEILASDQAWIHGDLEADDAISLLAWDCFNNRFPYVIVSGDKDMRQVPGQHLWPWTDTPERQWFNVNEDEALFFLWKQALTGDTTDGVPGCPSVGEKTAEKILAKIPKPLTHASAWEVVKEAYVKAGLDEDHALVMLNCVRLVQPGDVDDKGNIRLWTPPPPASLVTTTPEPSSPRRSTHRLLRR